MFVVKDNDGKNDHKSYKSIYFNYFLICSNRVKLFLAMQVRVMAACMESQAGILECAASAQSGRREVTVFFSDVYGCLSCFDVCYGLSHFNSLQFREM